MNFSVIVILYGTAIHECTTINTLLKHINRPINLTIHVWNNGPALLNEQDIAEFFNKATALGIKVEIYQDIRNVALSKIYNFFLNQNKADFITIFDQDSDVAADLFTTLEQHQDLDMVLPLCHLRGNEDHIEYPAYKEGKQITVIKEEGMLDATRVVSIASGLSLSKGLIDKLKQNNQPIFDENLAFYAIDTMFFLHRLRSIKDLKIGCFGKIIHSLSEFEQKSNVVSYRRNLELLYFDTVYKLNYKNKGRLSLYLRVIQKMFKGEIKGIKTLFNFFHCINIKKHPRAELVIDIHNVIKNND